MEQSDCVLVCEWSHLLDLDHEVTTQVFTRKKWKAIIDRIESFSRIEYWKCWDVVDILTWFTLVTWQAVPQVLEGA